jgi:predicted negative regulator of RcsB-dependent stress response
MIRLYALLAAVAIALSFWAGWSWRGERAEGAEARQQAGASAAVVEQVNKARVNEHTEAETMATIGAKH